MYEKPIISTLRDRHRIADLETIDLYDFASRRGLSHSQALGLVDRFGHDIDRLEREAHKLRRT